MSDLQTLPLSRLFFAAPLSLFYSCQLADKTLRHPARPKKNPPSILTTFPADTFFVLFFQTNHISRSAKTKEKDLGFFSDATIVSVFFFGDSENIHSHFLWSQLPILLRNNRILLFFELNRHLSLFSLTSEYAGWKHLRRAVRYRCCCDGP